MDPGWVIDRAILLTLLSLLSIVCLIQIIASKFVREVQIKYYTHYFTGASIFLLLLAFIDPGGVFGIYHYMLWLELQNISGTFNMATCVWIIYSHFRAHYASLKLEMPRHTSRMLVLPIIISFSPIGDILTYIYRNNRFYPFVFVTGNVVILLIILTDFYAYQQIRFLIIDMIKMEHANYQAGWFDCCQKLPTRGRSLGGQTTHNGVDYGALLSRLWKLHYGALFLGTLWIFANLASAIPKFQNPEQKIVFHDPNQFELDLGPHLSLLSYFLFIWWAWVPFSTVKRVWSEGSGSGKSSNKTGLSETRASELRKNPLSSPSANSLNSAFPESEPVLEPDSEPVLESSLTSGSGSDSTSSPSEKIEGSHSDRSYGTNNSETELMIRKTSTSQHQPREQPSPSQPEQLPQLETIDEDHYVI